MRDFNYEIASDEAKRAWQRGFDLAHPGTGPSSLSQDWRDEIERDHALKIATVDRISLNAAYDEAQHLDEECRSAMAMGFMRGTMAKAGAARDANDG